MRSIKQIKNIKGKTVLLRVDFNVSIKDGQVLDDFRIRAALPTIDFLIGKHAKIILITHLGKDGTESLKPVIDRFFEISKIPKDKVTFFENIRKFPGETDNNLDFAKSLSILGDIYVNDAFSVSHREHASIVLLPKLMPSYAGFQMEKEVKNLSRAFHKPKHPFLFILGGAKFSTKMPLIKKYLELADQVFIGGALANDFLKAEGDEVGKSLVDDTNYGIREVLKNQKLILPIDVVVKSGNDLINKKVSEVDKDETILDVGSNTVKNLTSFIRTSKLILWNGPLGKYEAGGAESTKEVLKLVADSKAESIIGGGDLVSVLSSLEPPPASAMPEALRAGRSYKLKPNLFVSTGGGATLDFLAYGTLPGIKALE